MISGSKIRQAREVRQLTQTELARDTGVNQSTIASVESGRMIASDELLAKISFRTGFPSSFFREGNEEDFPLGSLVLYRARAAVTAHERTFARAYAKTVYQCAAKMAAAFTPLPLRLPQLSESAATSASITRAELGLSPDTPVADLIHSVEKAGVLALALPIELMHIDAFSVWVGEDDRRPVIVLSAGKPPDKLRFSVAHEVGHLVMHQMLKGSVKTVETEADRFAAEFLLPEGALRQELLPPLTLTGLIALKRRWKVSIQTLITRARELSIITGRQRTYLFQQLSRHGWRKSEPISGELPLEKPRALRQMAETLYGNPIDFPRMVNDLRLPEQLLREAVESHRGETVSLPRVIPFGGRTEEV